MVASKPIVAAGTKVTNSESLDLDRLAAGQGLTRSAMVRQLIQEGIAAHQEGRELFAPVQVPIDGPQALELARKVEGLSVELDRALKSHDRRERRMLEGLNATEEANRTARERLAGELNDRFREGAAPYTDQIHKLRDLIAQQQEAILAATREPESLSAIRSDLAAVKTAMRRSRRQHHFHFGPNGKLQGWEMGALGAFALIVLVAAQILLATILPYSWVATPLSLKLFGSADAGICELYAHSRHLDRCPVLIPDTKGDKR